MVLKQSTITLLQRQRIPIILLHALKKLYDAGCIVDARLGYMLYFTNTRQHYSYTYQVIMKSNSLRTPQVTARNYR